MRILDVGKMYGYPCAEPLFNPWNPQVVTLTPYAPFDGAVLDDIDLIIIGGGQDICPSMYGHDNIASQCGEAPSKRDLWEKALFRTNLSRGKKKVPILGICRGAQFLCVMNGGILVQHVDNHGGTNHPLLLIDDPQGDESVLANSYHHQMMWPTGNFKLIGYTKNRSKTWLYDVMNTPGVFGVDDASYNPEIVLFDTRELAIQGHPEYLDPQDKFAIKTRQLVYHYLGVGENK